MVCFFQCFMFFLILPAVWSAQCVLKEKYPPVKTGEHLRWFCCACLSSPAHVALSVFSLFKVETTSPALPKVLPGSVLLISLRLLMLKFIWFYHFWEKSPVLLSSFCGCCTQKCLEWFFSVGGSVGWVINAAVLRLSERPVTALLRLRYDFRQ